MKEKYLAAYHLKCQQLPPPLCYFYYQVGSGRLSALHKHKKYIGHILKKLSMLIIRSGKLKNILIQSYKQILQFFLQTFNRGNELPIVLDLLYFIELLYHVYKQDQRFWVKNLRAVLLVFLGWSRKDAILRQKILLKKAYFSQIQEFRNTIDNEQINSKKLAEMEYFYKPQKYNGVQIRNAFSYIYLSNEGYIDVQQLKASPVFVNEQWLGNQIYMNIILNNRCKDYKKILELVSDNRNQQQQHFLKYKYLFDQNQVSKLVYLIIILKRLKKTDIQYLWLQIYSLINQNYIPMPHAINQLQYIVNTNDLVQDFIQSHYNFYLQNYISKLIIRNSNIKNVIKDVKKKIQIIQYLKKYFLYQTSVSKLQNYKIKYDEIIQQMQSYQ